jgi:O-acetyl-ADP-ribose deacetylase (regulator of RNase III)
MLVHQTPFNYIILLKNGIKLHLIKGDITQQPTQVLVNAANTRLYLGSGVANAIKIKGGPSIQQECNLKREQNKKDFKTGEVIETGVGDFIKDAKMKELKYIFHAIGPRYGINKEGNDELLLKKTFENVLCLCDKLNVSNVTLPPISTGVFRFPKEKCAEIFYDVVGSYNNTQTSILKDVVMCIIDDATFNIFECCLKRKYGLEEKHVVVI